MKIAGVGIVLALCLAAQPAAVKLPPFTREVLANGAVLYLMPKSDAPLLSLRAQVRGGAEADPSELAGLSSVVSALLMRGTTTRTAEQFASAVDYLGASIHSSVNPECSTIALDVLPSNASAAIDLFADAMLRPELAEQEVRSQLGRAVELARSRKDSPSDAIWQYFRSFFFRPPHPYSQPFEGDELTLERITRADVTQHYARMYVGHNLTLTAVGPFSGSELEPALKKAFQDLPAGNRYEWRKEPPLHRSEPTRMLLVDKPNATQTQFVIGLPGIGRTHPDRIPLWLVNNVLGGRFTSILNERLRVEAGLTYGAYSYLEQDRLNGAIELYSYTATANTKRTIDLALGVLRAFAKEGISADQLATARRYIKAAYPPDNLQTAAQLATLLADLELYGIGRDEVDSLFARLDDVTLKDANRVLKRYYEGKQPVLVLIGEAQQIRPQVRGYAPVLMEASISDPGFQRQSQKAPAANSRR